MTASAARHRWPPLERSAVRRSWAWRDEIRQQVVNTDVDGLLTGALLHHLKGWPVVGFYDTESLWLADDVVLPMHLPSTLWVDVDMCWPGARSLSQHVISVDSGPVQVDAHRETVNPNLAVGCHGGDVSVYRDKYPFGTFQWAAWIAGSPQPPDPDDRLRTGLAWMPDGGFMSVNHAAWRPNCLSWARHILPGSLMSPLATRGARDAAGYVEVAARSLSGASRLPRSWRNLQYAMSQYQAGGFRVVVDPATAAGLADVQCVTNKITSAYDWRPLALPLMPRRFHGTWRSSAGEPPSGWPASANAHEIVSMAITGHRKYCWTEPASQRRLPSLLDALGQS